MEGEWRGRVMGPRITVTVHTSIAEKVTTELSFKIEMMLPKIKNELTVKNNKQIYDPVKCRLRN